MNIIKTGFKKFLSFLKSVPKWIFIVAAICSIIFGVVSLTTSIKDRNFEAKREGFTDFMNDVLNVEAFANNKDLDGIKSTFQEMNKIYIGFKPIMDDKSYNTILESVNSYYDMAVKYANRQGESYYVNLLSFKIYQDNIYHMLYKALFGKEPSDSFPDWATKDLPKDFNPAPGITNP